ncbi:1030_t:CDS:2 [Racocetra fulgida]|uniref:1030_t:CDS:1 n=1 Tax=Racocetra fulgida TaxID=60492 RepID=A0A9N9BD28_9GLOM|nr:1030_t:CDS:2 [Racocetra fulgida]
MEYVIIGVIKKLATTEIAGIKGIIWGDGTTSAPPTGIIWDEGLRVERVPSGSKFSFIKFNRAENKVSIP